MKSILKNRIDLGLLILRIGLGAMFIFHGAPKLFGGPERWAKVGSAMGNLGIHFYPEFWGLMAALSEFGGGIALIIGFPFSAGMALLSFTMIVASTTHFARGQGLGGASHAIESAIVFFSLIFIGPGRYTLPNLLKARKKTGTGAKASNIN